MTKKNYQQLSESDRHAIALGLQQKQSLSAIARALGRSRSTISRNSPLILEICSCDDQKITVRYNKQMRTQSLIEGVDKELDNLIRKYALLNQPPVCFEEKDTECCCFLPLLDKKEEVVV